MSIPAVVMAGDGRAAKAVYGRSKVYLEVDGLPLVAHVVRTLQAVPEVDSVWVVGDLAKLEVALESPELQASLSKPLRLVAQQRDLLSNAWETYRRVLADDERAGRDPGPEDLDREILYLSGDLPLATPQEISAFVRVSWARGERERADYVLGLCPADALEVFRSSRPGEPGIEVAYFNTRDGRFRQNNLHYARPARIGNLERIEEMYEHRHQRRFWNMFKLALRLLLSRVGGLKIALLFGVMHLAGIADRHGWRRLARWLGRRVTLELNRKTIAKLLDANFVFAVTESGGCALDIDTEEEYDAMRARFADWSKEQATRSERLFGALPARAGGVEGGAAS
ncbi:MAG: NTP transferase domain-containing protein [Myxococcota bacterium]